MARATDTDLADPLAQLRRQRQRVEAILAREAPAERGSRASDEAAAAPASPERLPPDATDDERREFWTRRFALNPKTEDRK